MDNLASCLIKTRILKFDREQIQRKINKNDWLHIQKTCNVGSTYESLSV